MKLPVISNILARLYWAMSQSSYHAGNDRRALHYYEKFANIFEPKLHHQAYQAVLLIDRDGPNVRSKEIFEEVLSEAKNQAMPNENLRYVINFCSMYLCVIENNGAEREFWEAANQAQCDDAIRRWLLLPSADFFG